MIDPYLISLNKDDGLLVLVMMMFFTLLNTTQLQKNQILRKTKMQNKLFLNHTNF